MNMRPISLFGHLPVLFSLGVGAMSSCTPQIGRAHV